MSGERPPPTSDCREEEARRFSGAQAGTSGSNGTAAAAATAGALVPHATANVATPTAAAAGGVKRFVRQQVPDDILHNDQLNEAIRVLPANYNFEIHKTVWRIRQEGARTVALQFPEGLQMYACVIADILERFAGVTHTLVMGDVTYGACCIDDYSAEALGAHFLVHYGHSCLVPVDVTASRMPVQYVFVDIAADVDHLVATVEANFPDRTTRLALAGTIQFSSAVQLARQRLSAAFPSLAVPKCRPLSPGEVLGCTAPVLEAGSTDAIVFVSDGRFHLEAIMIANPSIPAYRYDPYARVFTRERYDHAGMRAVRRRAITAARGAAHWGVVLGTLGRQGNPAILATLQRLLAAAGRRATLLLMSEVSPPRLDMIPGPEAFVQIACPRLSIDWGEGFTRPTLTPYEAMVALGAVPGWWERPQQQQQAEGAEGCSSGGGGGCSSGGGGGCSSSGMSAEEEAMAPYPMDYYAKEGGEWNSSYHKKR
ncbi:hypothetical protein CHLRE_09g408500v5 [Chlamydomonas reinhardtii]|uniref:2-(3-amino-3-carboxypropyl)histidine synthase subunit 1 n=1 Tax=Chlamydomonas reinhardtii TaxID=3055 RepID=A0A2K3DFF8_CHLRE|nr:uncharacterized protein CHLRE_09g408500v5 [Chlamydomonas reinhardtii]PNW79266.1 hypothetical protein CHLRE_09g408500v5 [Chlamydomonas reinhardtii]